MTHPDLTQNTIPQFLAAFLQHLERLKTQSDDVDRFIHDYLKDGVCNQLAAAAVDKMSVTLADRKEHSSALIKPPVIYDIATIPVDLNRAKEWFAREHGSYTKFVEDMWEGFKKFSRTSSIFCHVMYGWGKEGGWVHLGVWPMGENPDSEAIIVPVECLTDEEKRHLGYDTNSGQANASVEVATDEPDILSVADALSYFASREHVESCDINGRYSFLLGCCARDGTALQGSVVFGISGYDADPRELYEIPEVRLWMRELDLRVSVLVLFLVSTPGTMHFVAFSLCDYVKTPMGAHIKPEALPIF